MNWLVGWHTRIGRFGMRVLGLHLLWVAWTLRGGIALGIFPATAAVYATIRKDIVTAGLLEPVKLRPFFAATWKSEFGSANRLGFLLVAPWAMLLINRRLVSIVDFGSAGPVLAGLLTVLGVVLFACTAHAWILAAQFDEGAVATVRRSLTLVAARPLHTAVLVGAAAIVLIGYYLVPGLFLAFGITVPAALTSYYLWSTGLLVPPPIAPSSGTTSTPADSAKPSLAAA